MKHVGRRRATAVTAATLLTAWGIQAIGMGAASAAPVTFTATGSPQSYTVPAGVIEVQVDALGAQGGGGGAGGAGGESISTLAVTPGQILEVVVGASGDNPSFAGYNGGGAAGAGGFGGSPGGGASDVRIGACAASSSCDFTTRVVVGAGGGGADGMGDPGGSGGGATGNAGSDYCFIGAGGGGGTQSDGGAGNSGSNSAGTAGGFGIGGIGGAGGGPNGGGGGGGYYGGGGGGGGAAICSGAGGGGSSFGPSGAVLNTGVQSGDGQVTITVVEQITGSSSNLTATEGASTGTVTVATVSDLDGSGCADWNVTAPMINWGDGTSSAGTTVCGTNQPYAVQGSHTYAEEGSYNITVDVTDSDATTSAQADGNIASAELTGGVATVADAPLSAVGVPHINLKFNKKTGSAVTKRVVANFTDADPGGTTSDFTAQIYWNFVNNANPGPYTFGTITPNGTGGWSVSGSHTYGPVGTYTVAIAINDSGGAFTSTVTQVIVK